MKPLLTIIIPTQNKRKTLKRAVKSVLNQTFPHWELFIVNDSKSVIKPFNDNRIKVISNKETKGANGARNTGLFKSLGKYIAFLDDDDEWISNKLETQINYMEKGNNILSYSGKNIFFNSKFKKYSFFNSYQWMIYLHNYIGTTSSVMILRSALMSINGFDTSLKQLQDYDLFLRLDKIGSFDGINLPLINYNLHLKDAQLSNNWQSLFSSMITILKKKDFVYIPITFMGLSIILMQKIKNAVQRWAFEGNI